MAHESRIQPFMGHLLEGLFLPVPRCLSKIRCVNRFFRELLKDRLESAIIYRCFYRHLHHQVRLSSLKTFSLFALSKSPICYNSNLVRIVFKLLFREDSPNDELQCGAMKMLICVSPKYQKWMQDRKIQVRKDTLITQEYRSTIYQEKFSKIKQKVIQTVD